MDARAPDVAVVGAGPAGCAAAIGLARAGCDVVLYHRPRTSGSNPGEIIESRVRVPLAELGIDVAFDSLDSLALAGNVSSWDEEDTVAADGMVSPYGLGALIDRSGFEAWLISEAERAGVAVVRSGKRLRAERSGALWLLGDPAERGRRCIVAPLVLQATGRASGPIGPSERSAADRLVCGAAPARERRDRLPDGRRSSSAGVGGKEAILSGSARRHQADPGLLQVPASRSSAGRPSREQHAPADDARERVGLHRRSGGQL